MKGFSFALPLPNRIAVLVTAAGSSARFGGGKKELRSLGGRSILDRAVAPFLTLQGLEALVITAPAGREVELLSALSRETLAALEALGAGRFALTPGGQTRRDSVRLGLEALASILGGPASPGSPGDRSLPETAEAPWKSAVVLVHDGARPWLSPKLVARVAAGVIQHGACVPVVPLVDTPKELGEGGIIVRHPKRASLGGVQTPQGFRLGSLLAAHRRAVAEGEDCTDDAELWDRYVGKVAFVPGDEGNRKVTYAGDLPGAQDPGLRSPAAAPASADPVGAPASARVGQGWDLHRLVPGRALLLGGVEVPSPVGEEAHSDGDVLLHAVIDALLGAAALGDIGKHFPPSDPKWKDADSRDLARAVAGLVRGALWRVGNLDCTVVLERPKLAPHVDAMRESIAACLGISPDAVSVKAKTREGLGDVGEGRAVEAQAIALLYRAP